MNWNSNLYSIILFLGAGVGMWMTIAGWQRRNAPGGRMFAGAMLAVTIWAAGYAFELGLPGLGAKTLAAQVEYLGIVGVILFWFFFMLAYTGYEDWLSLRNLALFSIEPALVLLLVWSNSLHFWFWKTVELDTAGLLPVFKVTYGPGFFMHTAYSYILLLASTILLIRQAVRSTGVYRQQMLVILPGALAPWIGNAAYIALGLPIDLTPFGFLVTGMVVLWSVYRYQLLDLTPAAMEKVVKNMHDGVIALDLQNRIVHANPAAEKITTQPAGSLIGKSIVSLLAGRPDLIERFGNRHEAREEIELRVNGSPRTYALDMMPITDRSDKINGHLLVLRDITKEKQVEQELRRQALVFENILDSVIITGLNGEILDANPATERMFGYSKSEMLGKMPAQLWHRPDEADMLNQAILQGLKTNNRWTGEINFLRKDGAEGVAEVVAAPLYDENGQRVATIGVSHDITDRVKSEHALRAEKALADELITQLSAAKEQAEAADRAKTAFLANMSHELRTPLTTILGYGELLAEFLSHQMYDRMQPGINNIQVASNHLVEIINDLLDISRIEANRLVLQSVEFDLTSLIEETVLGVKPLAEGNQNTLTSEIQPGLGILQNDPTRLRQVLLNLLGNACKFTRSGSIHLHAQRLPTEDGSGKIKIEITDSGIGMPPYLMNRLFQPFTQGDMSETRPYGGAGLGLAISQRLCQMMGGEITVESEVGKGSKFTVWLPGRTPNLE